MKRSTDKTKVQGLQTRGKRNKNSTGAAKNEKLKYGCSTKNILVNRCKKQVVRVTESKSNLKYSLAGVKQEEMQKRAEIRGV